MIHRFVKRTPNPKATKNRSGEFPVLLTMPGVAVVEEDVGVGETVTVDIVGDDICRA